KEVYQEFVHLMHEFKDIFRYKELSSKPAKVPPAKISFKSGANPYRAPMRRYDVNKTAFLREAIDELIEKGLVWRNNYSKWASPALVVRKPAGGYRFTVDLREVNKLIVPIAYPQPYLDQVLEHLNGSRVFSLMDLHSGYWQWPIDDACKEALSILTPF